jgi:ribulose-5-phosphate 4-epimerase/fuculose-1-phosphate aldolase
MTDNAVLPYLASDVPASSLQDLVDANRILYDQKIVDAFGHVSMRHPTRPDRFLLSRNLAPGLVTADDIVEYDVATGEAVCADPPRLYLERYIHSEAFKARPDVMAVVHNHSPTVLPFGLAKGAKLRPACHMCGFLGTGPGVYEIRDSVGAGSDLLIRSPELGADLARKLGQDTVVLMRGHGCTVVGESVQLAVYRAIYTEVNAKLLLASMPLGELTYLTAEEAAEACKNIEGQIHRPWNMWKQQANPETLFG